MTSRWPHTCTQTGCHIPQLVEWHSITSIVFSLVKHSQCKHALDLLYVDAARRMEGWKLSKFNHCNLPSRITSHVRFRLLVSESSADGAQEVSLGTTAHPNSAMVKVTSCEAAKAAKTLKVVLAEEIRLVKLMLFLSFLFI